MVVYDVTSRLSFEHLPSWIQDARVLAGPDATIILCGNKCDRQRGGGERVNGNNNDKNATVRKEEGEAIGGGVSLLEGSRFAMENDCMFLETSALDGEWLCYLLSLQQQSSPARSDDDGVDDTSPPPTKNKKAPT